MTNSTGASLRETGSREPSPEEVSALSGFHPARKSIHGEAVAGYGRKCRVCGDTAALEQLNRYWHYEPGEDGESVVWLPGRYCSRTCMEQSPIIDWRRAAQAIEARRAATASGAVHESAVPEGNAS